MKEAARKDQHDARFVSAFSVLRTNSARHQEPNGGGQASKRTTKQQVAHRIKRRFTQCARAYTHTLTFRHATTLALSQHYFCCKREEEKRQDEQQSSLAGTNLCACCYFNSKAHNIKGVDKSASSSSSSSCWSFIRFVVTFFSLSVLFARSCCCCFFCAHNERVCANI